MLGLNIDLSLLGIIQPYLFFVFSGLSVINAIYLFAIFLQGKDLFQVWNKKFFIYNGEPENITEDRIVEIEKEAASSHSLVSDLISRIREISSDRKDDVSADKNLRLKNKMFKHFKAFYNLENINTEPRYNQLHKDLKIMLSL